MTKCYRVTPVDQEVRDRLTELNIVFIDDRFYPEDETTLFLANIPEDKLDLVKEFALVVDPVFEEKGKYYFDPSLFAGHEKDMPCGPYETEHQARIDFKMWSSF